MKKKASLKDIANKVGVSIATVSYVLSKGKESKVSVGMTEKIKKAAKELNYQPNQIAKSLKSGKTFTIGLVVADISNPFFAQIARIAEDEAAKLGYTLVFSSSDEKASKSWGLIKFLINRQVDGFIIVPAEGSEDQIEYLKSQNIPFVLFDRYFTNIPSNYVGIDNYGAAYQAVEHLIETGNSEIGVIAYSNPLNHMRERIKGSLMAMKSHKLRVKENWIKEINFSAIEKETIAGINDLLLGADPVSAIFFASNTLAVHGIKRIDSLGYKIPTDVSVVSFDKGEAFDFYYSPITHILQPLVELGKSAVRILTEQIANPQVGNRRISLETKLIIQESCGEALVTIKNKLSNK